MEHYFEQIFRSVHFTTLFLVTAETTLTYKIVLLQIIRNQNATLFPSALAIILRHYVSSYHNNDPRYYRQGIAAPPSALTAHLQTPVLSILLN